MPQAAIVITRQRTSNIDIAGTYVDNLGNYITINNNNWYSNGHRHGPNAFIWGAAIHSFTPGNIIFQTSATTWSKIQYHTVGTGFGACETASNQPSAQAALDYEGVYDATDDTGCGSDSGNRPHSVYTPYEMPIAGSWAMSTDRLGRLGGLAEESVITITNSYIVVTSTTIG